MTVRIIIVSCLASICCVTARTQTEPKKAPRVSSRSYSVRSLVSKKAERQSPPLGLSTTDFPLRPLGHIVSEERNDAIAWRNALQDMFIDIDVSEQHRDSLRVKATAAVHAQIRDLLGNARTLMRQSVRLEVTRFIGPLNDLDRVVRAGPVVSTNQLTELERAGWRRTLQLRLAAHTGQTNRRAKTQILRYLRDYGLELATASRIYAPEMSELRLGEIFELMPTVSNDGRMICCVVRIRSADAKQPFPNFDTGLVSRKRGKLILQQPRVRQRSVRTTVCMPWAGAALVSARRSGDKAEMTILRHVPATSIKPGWATRGLGQGLISLDWRSLTMKDPRFKLRPAIPRARARPDDGNAWDRGVWAEADHVPHSDLNDQIFKLIQQRTPDPAWDESRSLYHAGLLFVTQKKAILQRVAQVSRTLTARLMRSATVRSRVIGPGSKHAAWLSDRAGTPLSDSSARALTAWIRSGEIETLDDQTICGLQDQAMACDDLVTTPFVVNSDSQVAQMSDGQAPVVEDLSLGTACLARVDPAESGVLNLTLQRHYSVIDSIEKQVAGEMLLQKPVISFSRLNKEIGSRSGASTLVALTGKRFLLVEVWADSTK